MVYLGLESGAGVIGDTLFVTGTQRSGTTLLEKLLAAQPAVALLSQPFPLLFVEAKRAFLRSLGAGDERYPLGHLFRESRYEAEDFCSFLARWRVSRSELTAVFERMHDYSGQYTKFTREQLDEAFSRISDEDDFADVVARLVRSLAPRAPETRWFGSKETICEEFVPYLLGRGFRCAIIIRDPRDVVASLNHGRGQAFGGAIKPLWFNVRNWRKSVALALSLEGHPQFHWCRYEDLVHDPAGTLGGVAGWLDVAVDAERVGG
ncbi:MAG TPA: sulfotransferase, partial [Thermoanaerobaculia bacterium]|nr:sulfotransferase [Thermoanaerobaculia bacterium]